MKKSAEIIGKSMTRVDSPGKLTGESRYAGDIYLPGMLYLKILRSDRPHARILGLWPEEATRYPGVVAIFSSKDIPGANQLRHGYFVLCEDRVRCIGDPVAMVAATTPKAAAAAAGLIRVDYEDLPGVFSPEEALLPDAVPIHDTGNLLFDRVLVKGKPEEGLQDAAVLITNTYRTHMVEHAYLEPEAGVANCVKGKVTIWMPSKYAHSDRKEIAGMLGLPLDKVRLINTTIGGSFGAKNSLSPGYYAALASLKTERPAKMVYSRKESFMASSKRHPFIIDYTTGADQDGRIIAVKVEVLADGGAYPASSSSVFMKSLIHATGPYEIPHVQVRVKGVYTNNPTAASMRGLGVPQMAVAHESQMDILAKTLDLDPYEIRLKNALRPGSVTATGQILGSSVGLSATLQQVKEAIAGQDPPPSHGSKRYGWGIASMFYGVGSAKPGAARLEADMDGNYTLSVGCGDVGQGSDTALVQIAAAVLRCPAEKIRICASDTDRCPDSGPTVGSRVTYVVGRAVEIAARKLKKLLQEAACTLLDASPKDLRLVDGHFCLTTDPQRRVALARAVTCLQEHGLAPQAEGVFYPEVTAPDPLKTQGNPMATYAFATQGALVAVDMDSGEVEVLSVVASHDVGRAVNPASVTGQIEGAISMGLGYSLMEEVLLDKGRILNTDLRRYVITTSMDMPEITSMLVEAEEVSGPFGAKGVGEPALIPVAPAILNAISTATGIFIKALPVTPEALWRRLRSPSEYQGGDITDKK